MSLAQVHLHQPPSRIVGWIVIGATLLMAHAVSAAELARQIRVLSYNIHHGEGVDGRLDLERIADVIREVDPDIVALQEVDQKTSRTRHVDQPAELARLTNMQVAFGSNIKLGTGDYGNAVLSRWPIVRHQNRSLPNTDGGEQRGVLEAVLQPAADQATVRILATHFDHRRPAAQRLASAEMINRLVADEQPHALTLLAGDLNDVPNSETLQRLGQVWRVSNRQPMPTIPVKNPKRQIDFVLYVPTPAWQVKQVQVLPEAVASDHRAILAVFVRLPAAASQR